LPHNDLRWSLSNRFATIPSDGVCVGVGILPAENAFEKALFWPPTYWSVILHRPGAGAKSTFCPARERETRVKEARAVQIPREFDDWKRLP